MDFFNRTLDNYVKLMSAAPNIYLPDRRLQQHRQPIVIKPSEINKLYQVPGSSFENILFYHGNFYVSPFNEPRYKYVSLSRPNYILHPDWIPMPVCVEHKPKRDIKNLCIELANS